MLGDGFHGAWSIGGKAEPVNLSLPLLRQILRYFLPYWPLALGALAVVSLTAFLGLIPPLLLRRLLDEALPQGNAQLLNWLAVGMIAAPLVTSLFGVLETYLDELISQGIMLDIRLALFSKLQDQTLEYFTSARPGEISSRLNNDVNDLQDIFSDTVIAISSNLLIALSTFGRDLRAQHAARAGGGSHSAPLHHPRALGGPAPARNRHPIATEESRSDRLRAGRHEHQRLPDAAGLRLSLA